jgi:hypothetical protein
MREIQLVIMWSFSFDNEIGDAAVPAFRDVVDVPLVVRDVRRSRKQVIVLLLKVIVSP